jgi:hypothetical protein
MIEKKQKKGRVRCSSLRSEQACVGEMAKLYRMARNDEISVTDYVRYVQGINTTLNGITMQKYGAEIMELKDGLERAKTENVHGNIVRLKRVQ